jgi:hypothetical protein
MVYARATKAVISMRAIARRCSLRGCCADVHTSMGQATW